ncbi:hypothetical protein AGMMS49940_17170 [Spirochaetia bacterium]|nr:hypothetical protein AGMMS49940_17170 [Spirochaetia bacterium]
MKTVKIVAACVLAAAANCLLAYLAGDILHLPLFLDTLFTCAVAFAAGTLPGTFTAILSGAINLIVHYHPGILWDGLFILCSIAEVLLIGGFRRIQSRRIEPPSRRHGEQGEPYSLVSTGAALFLLYIAMCMVVSILGGIIDFTITIPLETPDHALYPHTFFKLGLLRNQLPLLAADILSRIPVNIVDRFITAFGGYGLGVLLQRTFWFRRVLGDRRSS